MPTRIALGPIDQIPPGEGRVFEVGSLKVAIFHDRDHKFFATQPECPHLGGPLADGLLGSGVLVCPLHDRAFDLKTGASHNSDCRIRVYPTHLEGDQIVVTVGG